MDWKDLAARVAQHAPLLGGVLGGPVGAGVSIAGSLIASALGVANKPAEVEAALIHNPDAIVKLRQVEAEHKARIEELFVDQLRIAADDRASARRAAVDGGLAWGVFFYGVAIFLTVAGIEAWVLMNGLPTAASPELMGRILGTLDACAMASIMYTFGSSAGSARKDLAMSGKP